MVHGRTKQGLPLRSTIGMRVIERQANWFLVADRSHLRLFQEVDTETGRNLDLRIDFYNPDGRKKGTEWTSDQPGRAFNSFPQHYHGQAGPARHSYSHARPQDLVTEHLVRQAIFFIRERKFIQRKANLFVFADPRLTGLLRPALKQALPHVKITFQEKNFAWVRTTELKRRLQEEPRRDGSQNEGRSFY